MLMFIFIFKQLLSIKATNYAIFFKLLNRKTFIHHVRLCKYRISIRFKNNKSTATLFQVVVLLLIKN